MWRSLVALSGNLNIYYLPVGIRRANTRTQYRQYRVFYIFSLMCKRIARHRHRPVFNIWKKKIVWSRANEHANRAAIGNDWSIIRDRRQPMPIARQPHARCGVARATLHPRLACEWIEVKKWTEDSKHYTWIFNFFLSCVPFLPIPPYMQNWYGLQWKICVRVKVEQNNTYRWNITWMKSDFGHVRASPYLWDERQ